MRTKNTQIAWTDAAGFYELPGVTPGSWSLEFTAAGYLGVDAIGAPLLGLRVTHGIAVGALFSVLFTIAADVVPPERRAQGLALFGVSGMLPLALGGLMGDWLLVDGDYDRLFWAIGVCAVLGLLVSLPIPETRVGGGGGRDGFLRVAVAPTRSPP